MSRLALALMAGVGLLAAAFILVLILLDNPEAYKAQLSDTFETQTGYGLQINGDINWQYFPPIAIGMSDIAITAPDTELPLASLTSANVDLKVMPLLFGGTIEVSGLNIDGLTINAAVDESGKGNWEVTATEPSAPSGAADSADKDAGAGNSADLKVDIGGILVTNISINYQDQTSGSGYVINMPRFVTGPLGTGITTDVEAELSFEDKSTGLVATNTLQGQFAINETLDEFVLDTLKTTTEVTQPGSQPLKTDLTVNGTINTSLETAQFENTSVSVGGALFTLDLKVSKLFGDTRFTGKLSANEFNGINLLRALDADPGAMANPNALTKVSLAADVGGTLTQMALTNLKLGLDNSTLTGGVELGLGTKTSVDFGLTIDQINVSDYLSEVTETSASADSQEAPQSIEDSEVIPVQALSNLDVNGQFSIGDLTYDTWKMQALNLRLSNRAGALDVTGGAKAYGGDIGLSLRSQYSGNRTVNKSDFSVSGVDVAKALEVTAITGTIELKSAHGWTGSMLSDLVNTLDGDATFRIVDGTLDVRPLKQLAAMVESIQGSESGIGSWPDIMPFESLNGDHKINQGLAENQTFSANLENMQITGKGGLDYFENTIAYDIEAVLLANVGGQFTVNKNLANVKWPLRCAGSLNDDPVSLCLPDRAAIATLIRKMAEEEVKRRGRDAIEEKIDEVVPDELKDAAKDLLKGLFGN